MITKPAEALVRLILLAGLLFLAATSAVAGEKPFVEKRVVLQISDADPSKQTLVLNVASNLVKHYGPDVVDVEIVAFGPGLRLMFANNVNAGRISGLAESGVEFSACTNTFTKMTALLGEEPELDSHANMVPAGVVRIIDLVEEGYLLVKP